jgi:ATP-dependent exoDNAse (exonuclease V) beta subunit
MFLETKNSHVRDKRIKFFERGHKYEIDKKGGYMSVTTFNHSQFEKFNPDLVIQNMMQSKKWPKSEYFGKTPEEIKRIWNQRGKEAATAGTNLHNDIENCYNNLKYENESIEFTYFLNFKKDFPNLEAYRTEWFVFDEEHKLAGSIDMCFQDTETGEMDIYDWKRSKEIKKNSSFMKFSKTECISHIPDLNFWHYSLQLNTYKWMLEKNYDKKIRDMYLVCLHPNFDNYILYKVPNLQKEISQLAAMRKCNI